jgi:ERCC4-related helicase
LAYEPVRGILRGMLDERIGTLRVRGYLKKTSSFVSRMDLIDLGSELRFRAEMSIEEERGPLYYAISLQSQALTLFHMIELLDTQGAYTLRCFMRRLEEDSEDQKKKSHSKIVSEKAYESLRELLGNDDDDGGDEEKKRGGGDCYVEHPKLEELKKIVSQQISSNLKSRLLVFAQYRDTTTHLVEELNKVKGVRAERFVGQASKIRDKGLSQDQQASLIDDLRKGYLNTLCATSIAEEGLDIPEVDLVVFYEPIPSEIRYIQRRGRTGRRSVGKVIILATKNTNDIVYLNASQRRTEMMRKITETLNEKLLKPVLGLRSRPPRNPMTAEELERLEKLYPKPPETATQAKQQAEQMRDDVRAFDRMVSQAQQAIYMKILESGMDGLNEEKLYAEMESEEGGGRYPRNIVKAALHRLVKRNYLSSSSDNHDDEHDLGKGVERKDLPCNKERKDTKNQPWPWPWWRYQLKRFLAQK